MAGISVVSVTASPSVFTKGQSVQFTVVCDATLMSGTTSASIVHSIKVGDVVIATLSVSNVTSGRHTTTSTKTITADFGGTAPFTERISVISNLSCQVGSMRKTYSCTGTSQDAYAARLNPSVSTALSAKRASGGSVDDEGGDLCISAAITSGKSVTSAEVYPREALGVTETVKLYYAQERAATTADSYVTLSAAALRSDTAYSASGSYVSGVGLDAAHNYGLLLVYSVTAQDGGETVSCQSATTISRAFANVHLSGAMTDGRQVGGVAFGKFSTVANGDTTGKFECAYPAYFEAGIMDGSGNPIGGSVNYSTDETEVGKWVDDKTIYRKVITFASAGTTAQSASIGASVDTLISISGAFNRANGTTWAVNSYLNSTTYVFAWIGGSSVSVQAGNSMTGGYVILEYTKV